jgi:hypothetical protein
MNLLPIVWIRFRESLIRTLTLRILVLLGLFGGLPVTTSTAQGSERCDAAATVFLRSPTASSLRALRTDADSCWTSIGTSNEKLGIISASVSNGNRFAALYLASNLKRLDGGNLEDALIALGQFSEKDMAGFLDFARAHVITSHESSDALTMLPPSMSDDPKAQLAAMERRRVAVTFVSQKPLEAYKVAALEEINEFVMEIKRSMGNEGAESH